MNVSFTLVLFLAWAGWVAVCDIRSRRISNALVVAGLAAAFACAVSGHSPFGLSTKHAAIGASVGLVALMPFFAMGVMGAADVKVFAVLGAWCGVSMLFNLWMVASIVSGVHALYLLVTNRTRIATLFQRRAPTFELGHRRATPFAACLTVPMIVWLGSQVMTGAIR
jgi:prepilin peptidase CpaA